MRLNFVADLTTIQHWGRRSFIINVKSNFYNKIYGILKFLLFPMFIWYLVWIVIWDIWCWMLKDTIAIAFYYTYHLPCAPQPTSFSKAGYVLGLPKYLMNGICWWLDYKTRTSAGIPKATFSDSSWTLWVHNRNVRL